MNDTKHPDPYEDEWDAEDVAGLITQIGPRTSVHTEAFDTRDIVLTFEHGGYLYRYESTVDEKRAYLHVQGADDWQQVWKA